MFRPSLLVVAGALLVPAIAVAQFRDAPGLQQQVPTSPAELALRQQNDSLRSRADEAYQKGDYAQVVDLTSQVIQTEPAQPFAWYQRASAKIELGLKARSGKQIRDGIADARESLRLGGNEHFFLYVPYFYGLTSLAEVERRPEHADMMMPIAENILKKTELNPSIRAQILYQRGRGYRIKKDYTAAATDFELATRSDPTLMAAFLGQAEAFRAAAEMDKARAAFDRAVNVFPRTALVYNERGQFLNEQNDRAGAIADFSQAISFDPKFAVAYTNRGIALSSGTDATDWQAGESDFTASLAINPQQPIVHRLLGVTHAKQGKFAVAIKDFSSAIKLNARDADSYAERGFARCATQEYALAAADFQKALELNPAATYVLPWHHAALTAANEGATAESALRTALAGEKAPKGWIARLCEFGLGDIDPEGLLKATADTRPEIQEARRCEAEFFIGWRLVQEGKGDEAKPHFAAALKAGTAQLAAWRGANAAQKNAATK